MTLANYLDFEDVSNGPDGGVYEALKLLKVPTAMIRFNIEWHGTSFTPSNVLRTQLYLRSWFDRYSTRSQKKVAQQP